MLNDRLLNLASLPDDSSLNTKEAAFFLGVSRASVVSYAKKGVLRCEELQQSDVGPKVYRFRFGDLRRFRASRQVQFKHYYWDVNSAKMPERVLTRIFGGRNWERLCPDRKPENILPALIQQVGRDCLRMAQAQVRYKTKRLRQQRKQWRRRAKELERERNGLRRLLLGATRLSLVSQAQCRILADIIVSSGGNLSRR